MIPKKIHYCWFGGQPMPDKMQRFITAWHRICPDYEFVKWDEGNFDINGSIPFVREAYEHKKFAFVSDYVRLLALYNEGGIYIDTDVELVKSLDSFLDNRFFASIEYIGDNVRILNVKERLNPDGGKKNGNDVIIGIGITSAIFGAEPKHPYILDCINFYKRKHFVQPDGSFYDKVILTVSMALCAEKYGFKYIKEEQMLDAGIHIYPQDYFCHVALRTDNSVALHMACNSWRGKNKYINLYQDLSKISFFRKVKKLMSCIPYVNVLLDRLKKYIWFR